MKKILEPLADLEAFFGVRLDQVNPIVMKMALGRKHPPEWLRGITRFQDIPRVAEGPLDYGVPWMMVTQKDAAKRIIWIVENMHGAWHLGDNSVFTFAVSEEATYFDLRWS